MPRRTRAVKTREPVAASHMAYSRVPRDWRWSTCDVHIGVVWSDRCWSARMVEPNFALMGSRITFLESLMHPDHDSMRAFATFHVCEEHELVTAASMKDAMDSQHQPSSPRKQIEPGPCFLRRHAAHARRTRGRPGRHHAARWRPRRRRGDQWS